MHTNFILQERPPLCCLKLTAHSDIYTQKMRAFSNTKWTQLFNWLYDSDKY